jgi:hypothetical protein
MGMTIFIHKFVLLLIYEVHSEVFTSVDGNLASKYPTFFPMYAVHFGYSNFLMFATAKKKVTIFNNKLATKA